MPPQMLRRMMHMLRVLERAEKRRLERLDDGVTWHKLVAEADTWLDGDASFD